MVCQEKTSTRAKIVTPKNTYEDEKDKRTRQRSSDDCASAPSGLTPCGEPVNSGVHSWTVNRCPHYPTLCSLCFQSLATLHAHVLSVKHYALRWTTYSMLAAPRTVGIWRQARCKARHSRDRPSDSPRSPASLFFLQLFSITNL